MRILRQRFMGYRRTICCDVVYLSHYGLFVIAGYLLHYEQYVALQEPIPWKSKNRFL